MPSVQDLRSEQGRLSVCSHGKSRQVNSEIMDNCNDGKKIIKQGHEMVRVEEGRVRSCCKYCG